MIEQKIEQLLSPLLLDIGYELWGLEYMSQGKHSILRVYIDKADGINLEDCERVSHEVSAILDVEDPIGSHYSLEVSSPGVPRPIFYSWQYLRYVGKVVQIKLYKPVDGRRKYEGTIVSADDVELVLHTGNADKQFTVSNIVKANLIVE
jgi:ribosome maturation factor RimP